MKICFSITIVFLFLLVILNINCSEDSEEETIGNGDGERQGEDVSGGGEGGGQQEVNTAAEDNRSRKQTTVTAIADNLYDQVSRALENPDTVKLSHKVTPAQSKIYKLLVNETSVGISLLPKNSLRSLLR